MREGVATVLRESEDAVQYRELGLKEHARQLLVDLVGRLTVHVH